MKHSKMGNLISQGVKLGESNAGKWDNKWQNLIHDEG